MPVEPATLGAFALAATAIVVSPGPDTMLILRHALTSGRRAGIAAVVGVQLGLCVHTALAAGGISALIASSPRLLEGLAIAGACYLVSLGVQGFRNRVLPEFGSPGPSGLARACREAALCNILNPKVILLFLALYPNFLSEARGGVAAQIATLSLVLIIINVCWQLALVLCCRIAGNGLARPNVRRAVSWTTGSILIAFAVGMLWEHLR